MLYKEEITICILLAAYNGEKFISEQIESLFAQTYTNWKLFIRDDGSSDQTVSIINEYAKKDKRISIIEDQRKNLGSCQNFSALMNFTQGQFQYTMFCDQDDYWFPFKIEETLSHMQQFERQQEKEVALLVHTNFKYADCNLKEIASKKNFKATKISNLCFAHLLAQNPVYGCTMMLNKRLSATVGFIPTEAENHDYWVALVAGALGKISCFNKQTLLYRQHNNNISTNYDSSFLRNRIKRIVFQRKNFKDVRNKIKMALAFKAAYFNSIKSTDKKILVDFISFGKGNSITRLFKNIQNGVRRQTFSQTILFYLSILLLRKEVKS